MNLICFILFSLTSESLQTLKLGLVNHLLTASILFFFADQILIRFNTREFFFVSGLYYFLPSLSAFLTLSVINQINFPGFLGFFLDVFFLSTTFADFIGTSFFLFFFLFVIEHLYILFFFLKILYGVSTKQNHIVFKDLSYDEVALSLFLLSISFVFGFFPLSLSVLFLIFVLFYFLCRLTRVLLSPCSGSPFIVFLYVGFSLLLFFYALLYNFYRFALKQAPILCLGRLFYFFMGLRSRQR